MGVISFDTIHSDFPCLVDGKHPSHKPGLCLQRSLGGPLRKTLTTKGPVWAAMPPGGGDSVMEKSEQQVPAKSKGLWLPDDGGTNYHLHIVDDENCPCLTCKDNRKLILTVH
jgi:hypothetical protein